MRNASGTDPPPAGAAAEAAAIGVIGWPDDLLDLARGRGDRALARSVADPVDGLGAAAAKG